MSPLPVVSLVGEGLGQDLDPPAPPQPASRAKSGLDWFFLFLLDSLEKDIFKEAPFSRSSTWVPFAFVLVAVVVGLGRDSESSLLHRGYTFENPGGSALRGPRQGER